MKIKTLLLLSLALLATRTYGQDEANWNYTSRWQTRPCVGINLPITKFFKGSITDPLIAYSDHSYYLQFISATYFFSERWGIDFNFQGISSSEISNRHERYSKSLEQEYGNQYFVNASSGAEYETGSIGDIQRGFIGLIYRVEARRWFFYPKIGLGVTSLDTSWGRATLKQKNSNTVLIVEHSPGKAKTASDYFTIAPSLIFGYKLSKRIFIDVDITTSWFRTNTTYSQTTTNAADQENTPGPTYTYNRDIFTLSLATGLIIVIK